VLFDELCSCQTFSVTIPGTEMAVARKRAVCWKEKTAPISNPRPTAVNIPKNTRMNLIAGTSSEGWFGNGTSRMGVRIANAANVFATGISTLAPACQSISLRFLFLDSDPTRIIPPSASMGEIFPARVRRCRRSPLAEGTLVEMVGDIQRTEPAASQSAQKVRSGSGRV